MITLEDWALIRRLAAEGVPKAAIARRLGISRNTVASAVASLEPPKYERAPAEATSFTPFEARVRALLVEFPEMPATVIAERVGWQGSASWFRENVARLRPECRVPDPADRLVWAAGDAAQCDLWFPPTKIPLEDGTASVLPVLVIVPAHSRWTCGRMIPSRSTPDLLAGSWVLIERFGRVPRRLIWDRESGIGRRRLAAGVAEFCGVLATRVHQLKPYDPESKGVVERRNGYFETSFMPGRSFVSPADFNAQFSDWLDNTANCRVVRTIKSRPIDLVEADRAAMLPLPPVPPPVGWHNQIRLGRDYYVRVDTNDYSVDPCAIGRLVSVHADLERVRVRLGGRVVADHARVWARHMTVTDPAHVSIAKQLRDQQGRRRPASDDDGLLRDLADYDRAFNLDGLGVH